MRTNTTTKTLAELAAAPLPLDHKSDKPPVLSDVKSDNSKDIVRGLMDQMDSEVKAFEALNETWSKRNKSIQHQKEVLIDILEQSGVPKESQDEFIITRLTPEEHTRLNMPVFSEVQSNYLLESDFLDLLYARGLKHFLKIKQIFVDMVRIVCDEDNDSESRVSVLDLTLVAYKLKAYFDSTISPEATRTNREVITEQQLKRMYQALIKIFTLLKDSKKISDEDVQKYTLEVQRYTEAYIRDFGKLELSETVVNDNEKSIEDTQLTSNFVKTQLKTISDLVSALENMNDSSSEQEKQSESYVAKFISKFDKLNNAFNAILSQLPKGPYLEAIVAPALLRLFNGRLQKLFKVNCAAHAEYQIQSLFVNFIKIQFLSRNYDHVFQYIEEYKAYKFKNTSLFDMLYNFMTNPFMSPPISNDIKAKIMTQMLQDSKKHRLLWKTELEHAESLMSDWTSDAPVASPFPQTNDSTLDKLARDGALASSSKGNYENFEKNLVRFFDNLRINDDWLFGRRKRLPQARVTLLAHLGEISQAADVILEYFTPKEQASVESRAILTKAGILDEKSEKTFEEQIAVAKGPASLRLKNKAPPRDVFARMEDLMMDGHSRVDRLEELKRQDVTKEPAMRRQP